jgi:Uma2 family endonuclease
MGQAAVASPQTFQQFVEFERTSSVKHQLMNGEVFAMAGGTAEHARLILRVGSMLDRQLTGDRYRAFSSDLRVRAGLLTTYPDVTVVCGRLERDPEDPDTIRNPKVIVEVLSDSTEAFDRGKKFKQYRSVASLEEYILVSQTEAHTWRSTSEERTPGLCARRARVSESPWRRSRAKLMSTSSIGESLRSDRLEPC